MADHKLLRIVPDTIVLVSGLLQPLGPSASVLRSWRDSQVELVVCPRLVRELGDVLGRPRLRRRVEPRLARAFVGLLRSRSELRADPEPVVGLTSDPKDDYIVALALATVADYIVSGDEHLTWLRAPDPPVLTPAELVEILDAF